LDADPTALSSIATKNYTDGLGARWVPVAGRATVANENTNFANAGLQWATAARYGRTVHRVMVGGAKQIRLEYANWGCQNGDSTAAVGGTLSLSARPFEVANPNSVQFRASIEYPAGVWRQTAGSTAWSSATAYAIGDQVTSNGSTWVSIQAGTNQTPASGSVFWQQSLRYLVHWDGEDTTRAVICAGGTMVQSVPIAVPTLRSGTYLAVNSMVLTGSATNKFTVGDISRSKDFAVDYATTPPTAGSATDPVDSGVTTQTSATAGTPIPMPLMVSGIASSNTAVAVIGDSIVYGLQDTDTAWGFQRGYAAAAMEDTQTSWLRAAQSGSEASQYLPANSPLRLSVISRCTAAFVNLGVNDITDQAGVTATVQANLVALWTALDQLGLQVWQSTIMPSTTSTDSWATKANQTVQGAFDTSRQAINSWLRTGATWTILGQSISMGNPLHPLTGVVDLSLWTEDPTDSSRWLSNGTASYWTLDGTHPSPAAYASLASQLMLFVRKMASLGSPYPFAGAQVDAVPALFFNGLVSLGGAQDGFVYGDLLSSMPRKDAISMLDTAKSGNSNVLTTQAASTTRTYYTWLGTPGIPQKVSTIKICLGSTTSASATNATAVTVGLYVGPSNVSLTQVATGTVSTPTTTGEKDVALSNSVTIKNGQYAVVMVAVTLGVTAGQVLCANVAGSTFAGVATPAGQTSSGYALPSGALPTGTISLGGYQPLQQKFWAALA
jgi:lysophospholipase L1-like esterase